jgi:hypothetical protein
MGAHCRSSSSCCIPFCILQLQPAAPHIWWFSLLSSSSPACHPLSRHPWEGGAGRSPGEELAQQEVGGAGGGRPITRSPRPRTRHAWRDSAATASTSPRLSLTCCAEDTKGGRDGRRRPRPSSSTSTARPSSTPQARSHTTGEDKHAWSTPSSPAAPAMESSSIRHGSLAVAVDPPWRLVVAVA